VPPIRRTKFRPKEPTSFCILCAWRNPRREFCGSLI